MHVFLQVGQDLFQININNFLVLLGDKAVPDSAHRLLNFGVWIELVAEKLRN